LHRNQRLGSVGITGCFAPDPAIDGAGRTCWQGRCPSTPEAIAATLAARAPGAVRVGLETGSLSTWHWHALNGLGVPVVCHDARHAKAALSLKVNKSDANGALGLAQIVRMGWFREVRVKSMASHRTRAVLVARAQLVAARSTSATRCAAC
jgi:transposase